ncbi:MAG: hypothetical protein RLZZ211_575 [Bacteroidota bacterium]|jgi:hypothetical protein
MKSLFTSILLTLSATTFAQIPSYVPSNGLVGWWPFNGNANDDSGNGNDGTVNGAVLTSDRNGIANSAYFFNHTDEITTNCTSISGDSPRTFSFWMKNQFGNKTISPIWYGGDNNSPTIGSAFNIIFNRNEQSDPCNCWPGTYEGIGISADWIYVLQQATVGDNQWHHWLVVIENFSSVFNEIKYYRDGILLTSNLIFNYNNNGSAVINTINQNPLKFGKSLGTNTNPDKAPTEFLDDIGIWNRALTEAEIATLFAGCNLSVTTQPQDQSVNASAGTASFITASSSATATYQWQTNLGLGFQNLSNAGQYSGSTSATLTVSSLSMSNNNQVFRCIINDSGCTDTTSEAVLTIIDDASVQSNTPTTFKLYPNPVKDELFIKGMQEAVLPFEVYSTDGKKVLSGTTSGAIDVNALKKGSYQLKLKEQTIPFVKQ